MLAAPDCAELFVDFGEVAADARAEIGERAACVDESDEQNVSAILLQRNLLAALIGEGKIGDLFAGRGHVRKLRLGRERGSVWAVTFTFSSQ